MPIRAGAETHCAYVVTALLTGRFDVYVPRRIGPTWAGMNLIPRRGRDALSRLMGFHRALLETDHSARVAYEARAAASAPAADALIAESAAPTQSRASAPA